MRELVLKRITEIWARTHPPVIHQFQRHGTYYEKFHPGQKHRRPTVEMVQAETLEWLKSLDDTELLNHFERTARLDNVCWG